MKRKAVAAILTTALLLSACSSGEGSGEKTSESQAQASEASATDSEKETETEAPAETEETAEVTYPDAPEGAVVPEGYHFVWSDEFDGDTLSEYWFRETHPAGWVNHELQTYNQDEEYAYVKDGSLIIQPVKKVTDDGITTYYSGRLSTMTKAKFQYGYVEARIKVPEGKGFLPAFWMLPQKATYGNWPSSGEIDIMEVVGGQEESVYGTLHFGVPHNQRQGTYTNETGEKYSDDYHIYACEWEPGKITFFVDGYPYYSTGDWFSASSAGNERDYPAPFNQEFYIILNVAVGGDWPGDPDETTTFDEKAQMKVDYVRVYQKDEYDENVTKPEHEYNFREPDETGNYATAEWQFYSMNGGVGEASIGDDQIDIKITDQGEVDYAIQLVNEGLPMESGETYIYTFEAKADAPRTMITAITGPDNDYVRYWGDETVELTTDWKTYEYEFKMAGDPDDNARIEFNMGMQGTDGISIRNVTIKKK